MTFENTTGKEFTQTRKTIDQIMDYLKNEGYIMPGYGAIEALAAIITAFREDGKLEIDKTISTMGLYLIDNKLIPVRLEEYTSAYDKLMLLPMEERAEDSSRHSRVHRTSGKKIQIWCYTNLIKNWCHITSRLCTKTIHK